MLLKQTDATGFILLNLKFLYLSKINVSFCLGKIPQVSFTAVCCLFVVCVIFKSCIINACGYRKINKIISRFVLVSEQLDGRKTLLMIPSTLTKVSSLQDSLETSVIVHIESSVNNCTLSATVASYFSGRYMKRTVLTFKIHTNAPPPFSVPSKKHLFTHVHASKRRRRAFVLTGK